MHSTTPLIPSETKIKSILRDRCVANVVVNLFVKRISDALVKQAQKGLDILEFRVPERMTGYPFYMRDEVCREILQCLQTAGYTDIGMHPSLPGVIVVHFPIRPQDRGVVAFT